MDDNFLTQVVGEQTRDVLLVNIEDLTSSVTYLDASHALEHWNVGELKTAA